MIGGSNRHTTISSGADVTLVALLVGVVVLSSAGPAAAGLPAANATDDPDPDAPGERLAVTDASIEPGGNGAVELALTEAPKGLAGFEVTIEVADGAAAVVGAAYPDEYGLTTDPAVGGDGRTVTVEAVDLSDEFAAGASDVPLATVELAGVEAGTTEVRVAEAQVDADGGAAIEPSVESGTVTVEPAGIGGSSETASAAGDGSDATDTGGGEVGSAGVDGLGTGPALAIAAVGLALLVIARRGRRH